MAQFILLNGFIECPACGLYLTKEREQDGRVGIMRHPLAKMCSLSQKLMRVDRINGYGEEVNEA